jgi:A/G-specific adenine glycosylase
MFESQESLLAFLPACSRVRIQILPSFKHVLTHKDMHLSPVMAGFSVSQKMPSNATASSGRWVLPGEWQALGLPAPIRKLLGNEPDQ